MNEARALRCATQQLHAAQRIYGARWIRSHEVIDWLKRSTHRVMGRSPAGGAGEIRRRPGMEER